MYVLLQSCVVQSAGFTLVCRNVHTLYLKVYVTFRGLLGSLLRWIRTEILLFYRKGEMMDQRTELRDLGGCCQKCHSAQALQSPEHFNSE